MNKRSLPEITEQIETEMEHSDDFGIVLNTITINGRTYWYATATEDGEPTGPESDRDHDIAHAAAMGQRLREKLIDKRINEKSKKIYREQG